MVANMKIFCVLLILCISTAYAGIGGNIGGTFGIGNKIRGAIKGVTHPIVCNVATFTGNIAGGVSSKCKNLPGQNGHLGFVVTGTSKACTGVTGKIDKYLKKLTDKYCDGGSPTNTKAPTTQSTSTPMPTTTTSPSVCTEEQMEGCKDTCDFYRMTSLNFGPNCTKLVPDENNRASYRCDCIGVKHCETYTNATCTEECHNNEICRIPDRGLPCVCIKNAGKPYAYYALPSQL